MGVDKKGKLTLSIAIVQCLLRDSPSLRAV